MSDRLLLRLAPDGSLSWLRQAGAHEPSSTPGAPPDSALSAAAEIVVLVPAEDVLLTEVSLGARNRAQLMQALPYAVEDQLLAPVEELHFAAVREDGDRVGVAVVAKERLQRWLQLLDEAGIRADRMLPESLALPLADGRATAVIENMRAIVRLKPWSAFACAPAELPDWLDRVRGSGELASLDVHDFRAQPALALPVPVTAYRERQRDVLAFLAAAHPREPNLLDGEFAPRHRRAGGARAWRFAAALAAAAGLLAFANLGLDVLQLSRTDARLRTEATETVRKAFPDLDAAQLARLGPEQAMRVRLERQRGGDANGLLRVLGQLAPVLGGMTRIQTRGMEYRNGSFELAVRAPDVAAVDGVRERLVASGLAAEVTAANPGSEGVDGRIRIGTAQIGGAR